MDPAYPMLLYLADRFEVNVEQRLWLAFLYATTYQAATTWYIFSEFPDAENVDAKRLQRWWSANRYRLHFQKDRRWIKSHDWLVRQVADYRVLTRGDAEGTFWKQREATPRLTYDSLFSYFGQIWQFGRFALFLFLEAVQALTDFPMEPTGLDLRDAEECREGLAWAIGAPSFLGKGSELQAWQLKRLEGALSPLTMEVRADPRQRAYPYTIWNVETSLCAYGKMREGKRYLGYYIDRQATDIQTMQSAVPEGVDWTPLWDFRQGHFPRAFLLEEVGRGNYLARLAARRASRPQDPERWYTGLSWRAVT